MKVTIYHNPKCSKSRDALRFLRDAGIEPTIVLYLDTGWTAAVLHDLKAAAGLGWQEMLRPDTRAILQDSINKNEDAVIVQVLSIIRQHSNDHLLCQVKARGYADQYRRSSKL